MPERDQQEPIRVALVITELNVGGAEQCLVNLACGLDPSRFTVTVYSLQPRPAAAQQGLVKRLADSDIPVHYLNLGSPRQLPRAINNLRHLFAKTSPDIVQTFLFHANVVASWAANREANLVGGIRVADPRRARMWLERRALKHAASVVCVSRSVAEFAQSRLTLPAGKLVVIPNGIVVDRFLEAQPANLSEFGIGQEQPAILFVGRLERQKGVDWLLQAAPQILANAVGAQLMIVGDGPLRTALEGQAKRLAAGARIHFAGWRGDIPQLLKRSQLLVLPSRWEGMPNVVLEAMAAQVPVVATRTDGVEELLGAESKQIVSFGDDASLVAAVNALLSDREQADHIRNQNSTRVREQFSLPAMIARYDHLYQTLANPGVPKKNAF